MPPRRRAAAPPPIDLESVRRKLAEGKIVRVGITRSAQFPDGGTGRVRHVGDPAVDGDEFVQVELSLNGTRDILPFTPADLTPAVRGRPPAQFPATPPRAPSNGRATASVPAAGDRRRAADSAAGAATDVAVPPVPAAPAAPAPPADQSQAPVSSPVVVADTSDAHHPATPAMSRARAARGVRRSPSVAITVATTASEPVQWRIEARVGTKVAVRSAVVSPTRVWELVRLLDNEALNNAVGGILEVQRSSAQARADALAAELAQVRAELAALPEAGV